MNDGPKGAMKHNYIKKQNIDKMLTGGVLCCNLAT